MQVFTPYPKPILTAMCLDGRRLNKQLIECRQILDAIDGKGKGWFNHPVVKTYKPYIQWLCYYMQCLECYMHYIKISDMRERVSWLNQSIICSKQADIIRPPFLTEDFCNQHKRRLFTKNPEHYREFAEYGTSDENWYYVDGKIVKYINGKRI